MIILYGGSFDPVHIGHLIVANEVNAAFQPERFIFMPARQSPLKKGTVADDQARVKMLSLAVDTLSFGEISTLELERSGASYTFDTVNELLKYDADVKVVIGTDQYDQLDQWYRIEELQQRCQFIVVNRERERQLVSQDHLAVQIPRIDISSSEIRRRLTAGETTKYWLQDEVSEYIRKEHLYEEEESH